MDFLSRLLSKRNTAIQTPKTANNGAKTKQNNDTISQSKQGQDSSALKGLGNYGMAFVQKTNNATVSEEKKNEILNLNDKEKQEKLDKAGFTEEVIAELKQKHTFYGPEFVDEALNMAIYLDGEYNEGKTISKDLVKNVIDAFSPEASGVGASLQKEILEENWVHGDEIYRAYGQTPPIKIEELSPEEKQTKLDKAGFTEEVIAELKQKHTFYGPELIDEVLNMAIYLDGEYNEGKTISKDLVKNVIDAFSPEGSVFSKKRQKEILAEHWVHGELIKKHINR